CGGAQQAVGIADQADLHSQSREPWWSSDHSLRASLGTGDRQSAPFSAQPALLCSPPMNARLPLALIAAQARNRVIGLDNRMPWHLPADLKHFKARTLGKPIIMGRKTWDSLGRPLPGRLNIVVSRQPGLQLEGAEVFGSLEAALQRADQWAREQGVDELMLIGGAQLYEQALPLA